MAYHSCIRQWSVPKSLINTQIYLFFYMHLPANVCSSRLVMLHCR
jgi:hypothetical protein